MNQGFGIVGQQRCSELACIAYDFHGQQPQRALGYRVFGFPVGGLMCPGIDGNSLENGRKSTKLEDCSSMA